MPARKSLSKKLRFEVFKRDDFTCLYCGAHPPAVILEIDHVVPVCEGGKTHKDNLVTSCFDCNRGKGKRDLNDRAQPIRERADEIEERESQLAGFKEVFSKKIARIEADVDAVAHVMEPYFDGYTLSDTGRRSVRTFLEKLDVEDIIDAVFITVAKFGEVNFQYFCGVCWTKIKGYRGEQ